MGIHLHGISRLLASEDLLEHVLPHYWRNLKFGPMTLSNHIMMIFVAALLVLAVFCYVGMKARHNLVPTGAHNFFESMLSFLRTDVIRPALGENSDRFTPFIWTVFFFILFCNVLGMVPVAEVFALSTQGRLQHMWGTATGNFSITAGLALVAFVTVHASGIIQQVRIKMDPSLAPHHSSSDHAPPHGHGQMHGSEGIQDEADVVFDHKVGDGHDHAHGLHHSKQFQGLPFPQAVFAGIGSYIWNFAPHPEMGWKPVELAMWVGLLFLEGLGSLVKPVSLCIRLFANMFAGHLVLAALVGMIPFATAAIYLWAPISVVVVLGCTGLACLELFVAFLQAYIFTFLTTLYIASAIAPEH